MSISCEEAHETPPKFEDGEFRLPATEICARSLQPAQIAQVLDLFEEDSPRNVYRGELEVRPQVRPPPCETGVTLGRSAREVRG